MTRRDFLTSSIRGLFLGAAISSGLGRAAIALPEPIRIWLNPPFSMADRMTLIMEMIRLRVFDVPVQFEPRDNEEISSLYAAVEMTQHAEPRSIIGSPNKALAFKRWVPARAPESLNG